MPYRPLTDALARISRANEHLGNLREKLAILTGNSDFVSADAYSEPSQIVQSPHRLIIQGPVIVPILIGEIYYNLKSALDYLVFDLTEHDSGSPQDGTQFPIEDTEKKFRKRQRQGRLKGLSDAHVTAIQQRQPYKGCSWTWELKTIRNPDVHRQLVKLGGDAIAAFYVSGEDLNFPDIPLPITRAKHPLTGAEVEMKIHIRVQIQFPNGTPVTETLEKLILNTGDTLEAFKAEFQ